jgi:RNA polymerase sigma-70 factor (ECF subfamily)
MEKPDSTPQAQEAELIARIHRGEREALKQLYQSYFDRLYSLVFRQVGRNKEVAEDITQETFVEMLKSIGKFRGKSRFYTWLCSIAYHRIADFYRHQERQDRMGIRPLDIRILENNYRTPEKSDGPGIDESKYAQNAFEQALLRLPPDYRHVLIYKYVEEMSVREISQIMQRSTKSVEGLLARSREVLRKIIDESGEGLR